jgi:Transposase domain (DUF772)
MVPSVHWWRRRKQTKLPHHSNIIPSGVVRADRAALSEAGPAVEEPLYDSATLRQFAGIDLGAEPVPDETTVCKFRHLLEERNLGEGILGTVNRTVKG